MLTNKNGFSQTENLVKDFWPFNLKIHALFVRIRLNLCNSSQ